MRVGSLFSGIGGLELGLERAGMSVQWQVECDPYAQKVLAKHWPDVKRYDDVRTVHGAGECRAPRDFHTGYPCSNDLAPVDLICGGFPCQDISVAGKGKGLAGERSGLWREYRRILDEIRPTWVVIENVPALRSRGLGDVLRDLSSLGYDAEWDCLPAVAFGAPHRRDRLFVVAYANGEGKLQPSGRIFEGGRRPRYRCQSCFAADTDSAGLEVGSEQPARDKRVPVERGCTCANAWTVEPDVGRVAHGVPARVDRLRCLGNAVVPQVAEYVGRLILAAARD